MPPWLAGPLLKYGGLVLIAAAIFTAIFYAGMQYTQQKWDAAVMHQATKTASKVVEAAVNTAQKETKYIQVEGKTKTIVKTVKEEVIRYVPTPCAIDREFERRFDLVSRMRDSADDGLSTPDPAAGDPALSTDPALTLAEVLQAYHFAIAEWRGERDRNRALSEWIVSNQALMAH